MFDLRSKYTFDASESQIAEGAVSPYGHANDHANCVPASFTAALDLAGYGDIDPQRITNELFGPNYRGGFGGFDRTIAWIARNVPGAPPWTDGPFDFNLAEEAGQAGRLIIVAGWIDAPTVTFIAPPASWTHASLLVAHQADDSFVIWNTWTGLLQTYSRGLLAASLYEMAIMEGTMTPQENKAQIITAWLTASGKTPPNQKAIDELAAQMNGVSNDRIIAELVNRPEFIAWRAKRDAVIDAGPSPKGDPGPPGDPGKDAPPPTDAQVQTGLLAIIKRLLGLP